MESDPMQNLAALLNAAANTIDREDVPQTAEDTADFVDGARWATGQLRQFAVELTEEYMALRDDEFANAVRAALKSLR